MNVLNVQFPSSKVFTLRRTEPKTAFKLFKITCELMAVKYTVPVTLIIM